MSGMRRPNEASDSLSLFPTKRFDSRVLEIDFWIPSEIHAISPSVDRLMQLVEEAQCVQGAKSDLEQALRGALENVIVRGKHGDEKTKVHIRCRCGPGDEISILVTNQGKGLGSAAPLLPSPFRK
jgi:anti-sigma regulatory factor (Ser/Thr protein kinase)